MCCPNCPRNRHPLPSGGVLFSMSVATADQLCFRRKTQSCPLMLSMLRSSSLVSLVLFLTRVPVCQLEVSLRAQRELGWC